VIKDWVMEDISDKFDIGQFGGQPGMGTEHMMVCLLDRILQLLDRHSKKSAVIMTCLDWSAAFDRQDPTLAVKKFIQVGVRPSLITLLANYLTDRQMRVKFNGEMSEFFALIGGGGALRAHCWANMNTLSKVMITQTVFPLKTDSNTSMTCHFFSWCVCQAS
jgi:hypothetical protein